MSTPRFDARDGAFMEQSGRNQRQPFAKHTASKTAQQLAI